MVDSKILDRLEQAVQCPPGDLLLEVGCGYGALTDRLVRKGNPMIGVESDHKLFAMLERKFKNEAKMTLIKADILKLDMNTLKPRSPGEMTVIGNIPYYLTTPLIVRLLTHYQSFIRRIYLMVQKEVAERLTAQPGTKAYGSLTLCAQYYSTVQSLLEVPAGCFKPRPKVDSAFIEMEIHRRILLNPDEEKNLFNLVRTVFQSRRKTLLNSLRLMGKDSTEAGLAVKKVGLEPEIRGEKLSLEKFIELSKAL